MTFSERARRLLSYSMILVIGVLGALFLGKDMAWDQLNYHVYAGYISIEGGLASDYFAAGPQSYLNPYSHVPFYLMLKQNLAPQLIVALLALIHVAGLVLVLEMAVLLNRRVDGTIVWTPVGLAVLLAFLNPVFLMELGSSFNEISTAIPVLAGWYLLLRQFNAPRARITLLAGALIGAAVALKLTNGYFSFTALPLLLMAPVSWRVRARAVLVFVVGGLLGFVLAGGWWAWQMWEMFGNPFFPLLNQIFQSPEFTTGAIKHFRFQPKSALDMLLMPLTMTKPLAAVHIETMAPDLRYAALLAVLGALGIGAFVRRWRGAVTLVAAAPAAPATRALLALMLAFAGTWIFWVVTLGNSRYFLAMSAVAAVLLACLLFRIRNKRARTYSIVLLLVFQIGLVSTSGSLRWTEVGWGNAWYDMDIPTVLKEEPALYLNTGIRASFLKPYLAPGSGMVSISGTHVLDDNARTRALIERYQGRIRVIRFYAGEAAPAVGPLAMALIRFDLEPDMDACDTIRFFISAAGKVPNQIHTYVACKVKPLSWSAQRKQDYEAKRQAALAVFDSLELACPHLFQPRGLAIEGDGNEFWRNYPNSDLVLLLNPKGWLSYTNVFTQGVPRYLGSVERVQREIAAKRKLCP